MNKRDFLRTVGLSGLGVAAGSVLSRFELLAGAPGRVPRKQWTWVATDLEPGLDEWKRRFASMRANGIDAILPEVYNGAEAFYGSSHLPVREPWLERILPLAKAEGLEVHAWMWSMPCNIPVIREQHPDWFVVNRNGESAAVRPAYVDYYRFLCSTHPEAREFVRETVSELSRFTELDGVHLDYIRFPDVILAEALQPKYGIKQDREYPQYDYCYCDLCKKEFTKLTGIDISSIDDPTANTQWRQFRYDRITNLVRDILIPEAHARGKVITAAVFPNWEMVRQEWPVWGLDAALPMLYHSLYKKDISWIGEQTAKGVRSLPKSTPLYSGILVFGMGPESITEAVRAAYAGGANGLSLFPAQAMSKESWEAFAKAIKEG